MKKEIEGSFEFNGKQYCFKTTLEEGKNYESAIRSIEEEISDRQDKIKQLKEKIEAEEFSIKLSQFDIYSMRKIMADSAS